MEDTLLQEATVPYVLANMLNNSNDPAPQLSIAALGEA